MKKSSNFALLTMFITLLICSLSSTTQKNLFKQNVVMNDSSSPIEPTYVDSVDEKKSIISSPLMNRAETLEELVAPEDTKHTDSQFAEKPVMYTTVISPKSTNIAKPQKVSRKEEEEKKEVLLPGQYSIPVKVNLNKSDSNDNESSKKDKDSSENFKLTAENDMERIKSSLAPAEIKEKVDKLLNTRKLIKEDAKSILIKLRKNLKTVTDTKILSDKMMSILDKIEKSKKSVEIPK